MQVPFRLLKNFHKVQQRLVRELEKKFSGKDVVIIGDRRIMAIPKTGFALARPRSRTLTAVRSACNSSAPSLGTALECATKLFDSAHFFVLRFFLDKFYIFMHCSPERCIG